MAAIIQNKKRTQLSISVLSYVISLNYSAKSILWFKYIIVANAHKQKTVEGPLNFVKHGGGGGGGD